MKAAPQGAAAIRIISAPLDDGGFRLDAAVHGGLRFVAAQNIVAPGVRIGEQLVQQRVVDGMARPFGPVGADDLAAGQIQVADRVQGLMAHEFVVVAQTTVIQNFVAVDHDGVVEGTATGQTGLLHGFDLVHEAEGPGRTRH